MEKNYSAEINNIIALCYIIDDFKEFEKRLIQMIYPKYNRDFVYQLLDISEGKFKLGAKKAKRFYSENKSIIDTINKYSDIANFIIDNYSLYGKPNGNLQFFYQYILTHKDEIVKILAVLVKLKELGFSNFEFNETLDFTKEIYDAYPLFRRNFHITYVANAQVIPNYTDYISYKTLNSNYKMELDIIGDEISKYGRKITLNSLLFDLKAFPESVDRENTFEHILRLKNEQKKQSAIIRNSVDLDISVLDLEHQLSYTNSIISRLNGVENKNQLLEVLLSIKEDVEKLKTLSSQYDSSVLKQEPLLTPEVLEREKKLYLRRRELSCLDID